VITSGGTPPFTVRPTPVADCLAKKERTGRHREIASAHQFVRAGRSHAGWGAGCASIFLQGKEKSAPPTAGGMRCTFFSVYWHHGGRNAPVRHQSLSGRVGPGGAAGTRFVMMMPVCQLGRPHRDLLNKEAQRDNCANHRPNQPAAPDHGPWKQPRLGLDSTLVVGVGEFSGRTPMCEIAKTGTFRQRPGPATTIRVAYRTCCMAGGGIKGGQVGVVARPTNLCVSNHRKIRVQTCRLAGHDFAVRSGWRTPRVSVIALHGGREVRLTDVWKADVRVIKKVGLTLGSTSLISCYVLPARGASPRDFNSLHQLYRSAFR